ncbi:uncharacterized protein LOC113376587 [Ctenocephalides felis]|uniref:uncharacterized protein LOC113376587 n=1 Tax=Ctenocephalides felis TaxID=7515 RepID=UPI000E6E4365|nr:uncharacterized protein LOC113376587 [Ctenocephalides felis]
MLRNLRNRLRDTQDLELMLKQRKDVEEKRKSVWKRMMLRNLVRAPNYSYYHCDPNLVDLDYAENKALGNLKPDARKKCYKRTKLVGYSSCVRKIIFSKKRKRIALQWRKNYGNYSHCLSTKLTSQIKVQYLEVPNGKNDKENNYSNKPIKDKAILSTINDKPKNIMHLNTSFDCITISDSDDDTVSVSSCVTTQIRLDSSMDTPNITKTQKGLGKNESEMITGNSKTYFATMLNTTCDNSDEFQLSNLRFIRDIHETHGFSKDIPHAIVTIKYHSNTRQLYAHVTCNNTEFQMCLSSFCKTIFKSTIELLGDKILEEFRKFKASE